MLIIKHVCLINMPIVMQQIIMLIHMFVDYVNMDIFLILIIFVIKYWLHIVLPMNKHISIG